jgi:molecular chaperone HtpG
MAIDGLGVGDFCGDSFRTPLATKKKTPLLVLERIETRNGSPIVERCLVSPEALEQQSHFWTIESRLVDSLGIISRDLGRELSLNEFLTSLAPEHAELGHSPILPDANLFAEDIKGSHHPDLVQFSRLYQQTAIKWTPGKTTANEAARVALKDETFSAAVNQELRKLDEHGRSRVPLSLGSNTAIAEIVGDEPKITIVRTRMGTLLEPKSEVARIWELLKRESHSVRKGKMRAPICSASGYQLSTNIFCPSGVTCGVAEDITRRKSRLGDPN